MTHLSFVGVHVFFVRALGSSRALEARAWRFGMARFAVNLLMVQLSQSPPKRARKLRKSFKTSEVSRMYIILVLIEPKIFEHFLGVCSRQAFWNAFQPAGTDWIHARKRGSIKGRIKEKFSNPKAAFQSMDRDGGGSLSRVELSTELRKLGIWRQVAITSFLLHSRSNCVVIGFYFSTHTFHSLTNWNI
jgi:hypothetical protein